MTELDARRRAAPPWRLTRTVVAVLAAVAAATVVGHSPPAAAAPHKILVLPVEGAADAATRAKLTTQIVKLARALEGQVATADATFADTALAVGCDPKATSCRDEVMATLGVDELVWAVAVKDAGHTRLVVRRAAKATAERELSATIAASDSPDQLGAALAPLFAPPISAPEPAGPPPVAAPAPASAPGAPAPAPDLDDPHGDHNIGLAFGVGGGVALVLGLAMWVSYASVQDSIDHHATATRGDFDDLIALEDRASTYAIAGDVLVVAGLAAGGVAAYYLFRDHHQHAIAIAPAPIGHGAGLTLTILGGL
jgi:hypothetical protein